MKVALFVCLLIFVCLFCTGTIRKFLEMQEELGCVIVHTIVLVVESCDASMYEVLLPLYFPRSLQEERTAVMRLPLDNDYVHNDRRIRIIDNPQHYSHGK